MWQHFSIKIYSKYKLVTCIYINLRNCYLISRMITNTFPIKKLQSVVFNWKAINKCENYSIFNWSWMDLLTIIYGCIHENQGNHWSNPGRQCWVEDLADCIVQHVRRIKSDVSGRYFCKFNKVCRIILRLIWFWKIILFSYKYFSIAINTYECLRCC